MKLDTTDSYLDTLRYRVATRPAHLVRYVVYDTEAGRVVSAHTYYVDALTAAANANNEQEQIIVGFKWNPEVQESTVWPNPQETRRMAAFARERGVYLAHRHDLGVVAIDPRDAAPHVVTGFSYDCGMFAQAGGCQHFSLFVDEMIWIPEAVLETAAAS